MSESKLMKIVDGRNIALIYIFSALSYLLYYFVVYTADILRESTPLLILGGALLIIELILFILPAVAAGVGIKQKNLRPLPAVLTIIPSVLLLLYLLFMAGSIGSVYEAVQDVPKMIFFLALTLSILYGFAAFAVKGDGKKLIAAKIFGVLHALFGAGMTYFYYIVYYGMQAYDYDGAVVPDVWYYSPESLLIGFGIWAVLGLIAGILIFANKNNS